MERFLFVGLGGFVGAITRYVIADWVASRLGYDFPWGTMVVNFTGSLLLGVFIAYVSGHVHTDLRARLFIATGFFGAYTTFSTFANESVALLEAGNWTGGLSNILVTNFVCIIGAAIGVALGGKL